MESLGEKIAELRKKHNLTQADLAAKVGKSTSTVAMWETGQRDPDTTMLVKLSEIFKVSSDYMLGIAASYNLQTFLEQTRKDSLGEFFKNLRLSNGFVTKKSLAEISGVTVQTISNIENNEQHPYPQTIEKLAPHFKEYTSDELLAAAGWFPKDTGDFFDSVKNDNFLRGIVGMTPLEKIEFYRNLRDDTITQQPEEKGFYDFITSSEHNLFFKELLDAPQDRIEDLKKVWEIIKRASESE